MYPDGTDVTAGMTTLFLQAPKTVSEYMTKAVDAIDSEFGKGFAKNNPALVGAFIQASTQDFHTAMMKVAAQDLGGNLNGLSMAIESLSTSLLSGIGTKD